MRVPRTIPLMVKVTAWLALHLGVLALSFYLFVRWQLDLGLDSLLTSSAEARLTTLGESVEEELVDISPGAWETAARGFLEDYELEVYLRDPRMLRPEWIGPDIPASILEKIRIGRRPPSHVRERGGRRSDRFGDRELPPRPPDDNFLADRKAGSKVLCLERDPESGTYWAAIELVVPGFSRGRDHPGILFLKSESASAGGLFFDYRPWLLGAIAVFALSVVLWTPFVLGITRYAKQISRVTGKIANGEFEVRIGASRNDELGQAGRSIESMSSQLGHLIHGQKRFLGDVAHELCAPLARMRTGLGVLENSNDLERHLESIDEDAEELSNLISELLAFTKANAASVELEDVDLKELLEPLVQRELSGCEVTLAVPSHIVIQADRRFLTRALLNVLRNCLGHAGAGCEVRISSRSNSNDVNLTIEDDGPGVEEGNLPRLFEPFFRTDRSRSRDTGGTGLGLAIVESSISACGGGVSAERSSMGGLAILIRLPRV